MVQCVPQPALLKLLYARYLLIFKCLTLVAAVQHPPERLVDWKGRYRR